MLGCALAGGLFARHNSFLRFRSLPRKRPFSDTLNGSLAIRGESTRPGSGRRYDSAIRGVEAGESCARVGSFSRNGNAGRVEICRAFATKPYELETNLPKDVLLYKYENPNYHKWLNIFAISQLLFWTYLAHFVFTELRDIPVSKIDGENLPWWRRFNLGESVHRTALTILTFLVGYGIFCLCWTHTLKSVKYLVLRKGGEDITFVTNTPFGENRLRTVPLDRITCKQSRTAAKDHLPIKVKGDMMHYLLDMRGEFRRPELFDFTAGLKRST